MAKNLLPSSTSDLDLPRDLGGFRARIHIPYRSGIYRVIRMFGMVTLLASLILIGFSVRPSLRKPKF